MSDRTESTSWLLSQLVDHDILTAQEEKSIAIARNVAYNAFKDKLISYPFTWRFFLEKYATFIANDLTLARFCENYGANAFDSKVAHLRMQNAMLNLNDLTFDNDAEGIKILFQGLDLSTEMFFELWNHMNSLPASETGLGWNEMRVPRELYDTYIKERNRLVDKNYKLVISIAHRYSKRWNVPLEDMVQEGTVGMIRAATKFQAEVGVKFSTYGTWWIHQYIARHLQDKEKFIRAPQYVQRIASKLGTIEEHLAKEKGREPTTAEIAEFAEIPIDIFNKIHPLTKYPISLESTIMKADEDRGNNALSLKDMLRSDSDVEEEVDISLQHAKLKDALEKLSVRDRDILERRYGLGNRVIESLEEVAEVYKLSRERIRQIQGTSILKVRSFLMEDNK